MGEEVVPGEMDAVDRVERIELLGPQAFLERVLAPSERDEEVRMPVMHAWKIGPQAQSGLELTLGGFVGAIVVSEHIPEHRVGFGEAGVDLQRLLRGLLRLGE